MEKRILTAKVLESLALELESYATGMAKLAKEEHKGAFSRDWYDGKSIGYALSASKIRKLIEQCQE